MRTLLYSLREAASQQAVLAESLHRNTDVALGELDLVVRGALDGDARSRGAMLALARLRIEQPGLPYEAWSRAASAAGLRASALALATGAPLRQLPPRACLAEPLAAARLAGALASHRSAWDAGQWRHRLYTTHLRERLLCDPRPAVTSDVLCADTVYLRDAVRVAARRPTTPGHLRAVVTSRWLRETQVREALVQNPYAEQWLAVALATTVARSAAREASHVAALLRDAALL